MITKLGGAALGIGSQALNGFLQYKSNKWAADYQHKLNEQSAENAFKRQNQMTDKLYDMNSPSSQVKRLEDAGLSVGLMYGGGGAGGGGGATSGAAPQAQTGMPDAVNFSELKRAETEKQTADANIELMKANAELAKAEAKKIAGEDTDAVIKGMEEADSRIELNKLQGLTEQAKAKAIEAETRGQNIANYVAGATQNYQIEEAQKRLTHLKESIEALIINNHIQGEAAETIIESYNASVMKTYAEIETNRVGNKLTEAQVKHTLTSINDIVQNWKIDWSKLQNNKDMLTELNRHNIRTEDLAELEMAVNGGMEVLRIAKEMLQWKGSYKNAKNVPKPTEVSKKWTNKNSGTSGETITKY